MRLTMSDHMAGGHPAMNYPEHHRTYGGFLTATKLVMAVLVVLLIGMYVFLV
jgi:hypothetical protein